MFPFSHFLYLHERDRQRKIEREIERRDGGGAEEKERMRKIIKERWNIRYNDSFKKGNIIPVHTSNRPSFSLWAVDFESTLRIQVYF